MCMFKNMCGGGCDSVCGARRKDWMLLITRLIVGGIFILSGWAKVSDMAATVAGFGQMGIPSFLAYAVSYIEFIGGILLVLGVYTCTVSAVLAVIMIFAVWFTRSAGLQGFGFPLSLLAALLSLCGACGGRFSLYCPCAKKPAESERAIAI